MKVSRFEVVEQSSGSDLQTELELEIENPADRPAHAVRYAVNFLDGGGFPLEAQTGWTVCELDAGESTQESVSASLPALVPATQVDSITARATATIYSRERILLGEVKVPGTTSEAATLTKETRSTAISSPLRAIITRTPYDSDGDARPECKLLLASISSLRVEVELQIDLLDADGDEIGSNCDTYSVPAMSTICVDLGGQFAKKAQLDGASLKVVLSIYSPVATVECASKVMSVRAGEEEDDDERAEDAQDVDVGFDVVVIDESDVEESTETDEEDGDHEPIDSRHFAHASNKEMEDSESEEDDEDDLEEGSEKQPGVDPAVLEVLEAAAATEFMGIFAENEITADVLASLTDADLNSIGVAALGARKRILAAIAKMGTKASHEVPRAQPVPATAAPAPMPHLRDIPRSACPTTDWTKLTSPFTSHFSEFGRVVVNPAPAHKKLAGARTYATQLNASSQVFLLYDDTFLGSAKNGVVVSDQGVHWKNLGNPPAFTPWSSLPVATARKNKVTISPGAVAGINFGGAQCALRLACFINAGCGAFMASMRTSEHPQHNELHTALTNLLQDEHGSVVVQQPDATGEVRFSTRGGRLVLAIHRPQLESAEGCRIAALAEQIGGFREHTTNDRRDWFERTYAVSELDRAAHNALLAIRTLNLKPEGTQVRIEVTGAARQPNRAPAAPPPPPPATARHPQPNSDGDQLQAIGDRVAHAVNRENALRPFFVLVGINDSGGRLRFSLRLSRNRVQRSIKIRMRVEVDGMPRYASDTIEMVNDKVMDDYLSAELERLIPDLDEYSYDLGVEIGPMGFTKPTLKSDHQD